MKNLTKILTLFILICFLSPMKAQKFYDNHWKKIAANYQKGQYKSNLPIILEIQNRAMKEDNAIQLIKSLKAEFSVVNLTEDDTENDAASQFFKKLKTFDQKLNGEEKLVYQVLLGDFFKDYYDQNDWEINQRTNVKRNEVLSIGEDLGEDIETWSKLDFKNYFAKYFTELSKNDSVLQKIPISKYAEIFEDVEDIAYFPTFFDYKSIQFVDFLQNNNFFTKNELKENQPKILGVYNELIAKNSGNSKLYFQHQKLEDDCNFNNCKDRQEQLLALYNSSTEGDYKVLIAQEIIQNLQHEQKFEEALSWVEKEKKTYPKSKFLENIKNQENQIKQAFVTIKFETSVLSNQPIHLVAEYKNALQFSLNIYEVKSDYQGFLKYIYNSWQAENYTNLKRTLVRQENYNLPKTTDYKTHKTSLEIKPLPSGIYVGEYVVEGKVQEKFYFIAANSRIIYQNKNDRESLENQLKLVNRNNGKILPKENLEFYEFLQRQNLEKSSGSTDENSVFNLPITKNRDYYRTILVRQPKTNDFNLVQVYGNQYGDYRQNDFAKQSQIFLDRQIYRPGQTVYFKVISTKLENDKEVVFANDKQEISLYDVNNEKISSQTFTTNQFGSFNGNFVLPQGKLNGSFSLRINEVGINSYKDFRVEEYKRPKFEVTFEPVKEEYKYGQTIELQGKAMMFSGVSLSNSTVNFEIKKHNIRWRYFWWYPQENDYENSILGEAKTNEKGEFTIKLNLKKDETLEGIQIDNYEINASVTDINGETQSANTNLTVSSVSHYITLSEVKNDYFTDENVTVKVETKNYNEQNLKKSYTAKLSKLEEPKRIFRNNFENEVQNLPVLSKENFIQKFPHDYFEISEMEIKVEKVVFEKVQQPSTDNQQPTTSLDLGKLSAGKYKLELFNIEGKDTIKTEKIFEVFDKTKLGENQKPYLKVLSAKSEYNRNEKAKFYIYSAISNALVNVFIQNGDGKTKFEQLPIKNGILVYETALPKDESIDQLNVQFQLVAFNDVQTETENVKIITNKKPLKIELVTFRDKLQPNSKEKWSVKIIDDASTSLSTREKLENRTLSVAEVLANMYDKSLDQFAANSYYWQKLYNKPFWIANYNIREGLDQKYYSKRLKYFNNFGVNRPSFDWFDGEITYQLSGKTAGIVTQSIVVPEPVMAKVEAEAKEEMDSSKSKRLEEVVMVGYGSQKKAAKTGSNVINKEDLDKIPVRQNLNETAFFYPNLMTDKDGNVSFEFTSPEALTQWKLMFLAHTKDAQAATLEKTVVTQKDFSVTPNYPRFLREGDELVFKSKLANLSAKNLNGTAQLQILDAFTNEDISEKFDLKDIQKSFVLNANGSTTVQWKVKVPNGVSSIIIKNVATSTSLSGQDKFSDGEQKAIAVLPNRMLVTDAVPVFVKEGQTKTFVLENLKNNTSKTATNVSNTLELTTNPIWEVIFALPSLKNDNHLSADVVFNKWFADVLATEIFKADPKMKTVFDEYQAKSLLNSNLEKNQELMQLLLDETPWVLDSKNETEQMQKLARLFDANNMRNSINEDWNELKKLQNPDGGFSWYAGYPSSYYNSLYILKNLGRINEWLKDKLDDETSDKIDEMADNLVKYVDNEVSRYFDVNAIAERSRSNVWSNYVLDYLDTRHYWEKEYPLKGNGKQMKDLVISKAKKADIKDFTFFGLHRAALLFDAYNLKDVSKKLMTYLKETSVQSETQGVYWKQNLNDWGWYSSKTVNHAGALEAFNKLTTDVNFVEEMKIWLITQKEVSNWDTSRSTAEVIYTILNSGKSWTSAESDKATIIWGDASSQPSPKEKEQGATGYFKKSVISEKIDKNLATVTITKPGAGIVQGGLFWQYYEDLDKIKSSETYISITKELYKKVKTVNGEELQKITENAPLKIGDKVTVRMILNTDRNMEFIHLKDMRAAGFEPVDVLSGYQWKNNLGYYQVTKDASTNFYIEYMPKGKYVFEYDYICNVAGTFSNGITTMQNYYAPQMNAHTQGTKVSINE